MPILSEIRGPDVQPTQGPGGMCGGTGRHLEALGTSVELAPLTI